MATRAVLLVLGVALACMGCSTGELHGDSHRSPDVRVSDGGLGIPMGTSGGECYPDATCNPGLECQAELCTPVDAAVPPSDGSTVNDAMAALPDAMAALPDLTDDVGPLAPCPGALYSDIMHIGDNKSVTDSGKSVAFEMVDIGVSGTGPAALVEIDGALSIIVEGQSDTSKAGFKVMVVRVQNVGSAMQRWAQVCVYP